MTNPDYRIARRVVRAMGVLAALAGALIASAGVASAATITVTTGLDEFNTIPNATCSLREAIQAANTDNPFGGCVGGTGNDVIVFAPAVTLVQLTIVGPGADNDDNSFLDLDIRDINPPGALVIDGGLNGVTIQPGVSPWNDRIFDIPQVGGQPSPVTLRNLTIQGGGFPGSETGGGNPCFGSGGGVRNWSNGPLTLENVIIQNNTMPMNGGGVCHQTAGALTVLSSTIRDNVATNMSGGGIFYQANGALTVQGSTVLSNTASRSGGGIYDQSSVMTIQNSQVLSNTVNGLSGPGGGVWTAGGTSPKQILTSTVAYNRADGDGGGIYNQTAPGLQLFNSTVLSNTAGAFLANPGNGGGIWSAARLQVINSRVLSNTALFTGTTMPIIPPGGGGIYQQGVQITVGSSQVAHNLARALSGSSIAGGGIWNSGNATLNNTTVEHNLAEGVPMGGRAYGGGIHNENRLNLLSNSQVRHNRAEWFGAYGGGVSNNNSSGGSATFTLNTSSVSTNTAQGDPLGGFAGGGGIYSTGTADLLAGEVRNNLAAGGQFASGGGIDSNSVLTVTSSLVISNAATAAFGSLGGGIQTAGSAALITNTQIHTNTAGNGGGWYNTVFSAQLNNSDVRFNEAATKDGGGIYNVGSDVQVNNSAICQNQAQQHGGGVYNGALILIGQTTICLNQAGLGGVGDGGGIYNNGGLQVMMSQVLTNTTVDNGGGVFSAGTNAGIFNNSTLGANQASAGGGAYNAAGNMLIDTSTLRTNQANGDGGGAYNADQMFVVASTVQSNTANSLGGGVYNASSATGLLVNVSTLRGNNAATGGGLYNAATANVSFSALVNNTANFGGGAHNTAGGALSSENNTFSGNSAPNGGGLDVAAGSSAYLTFTTVASNTAGGGINVSVGGTAKVYATLLAYNAGNNCAGVITHNGFSMSSDGSCIGFAFNNTNPLLQPLALNGGQTLNHALSPGSPALDQVTTPCPLGFDQRVVSRPQGTACDIGAFELEEADLEVSKSASPSPVIAGQTITYTVIVTNVSTSGFANNVVLTDTLLGGTTFGGVVSGGGFTLQSSTSSQAVFTLSSLAAGSSATLVFTATAPASGPITNTATVTSGNPDPVLSNNTASVSTPVIPAAYLAVSKAQDFVPYAPGIVLPGATVTYTIVVTNTGPSAAAPVFVQDTLASGVGFVAAGGSGWSCSFSAPTVTCNHPAPLLAGASASVMITVTAPITSSTVFTNVASGIAPTTFPGTPFASNVVTLTTAANAELRLFKTAAPSPVFAGQLVTYVVAVQNFGPDVATNLVITDVFQGGASFGSVIGTSGGATFQISTTTAVTFTVPSLGVGSSAVMTYTVVAPADGVITNTATVASDAVDPAPANNVFSTNTPVTPVANLSISKAQSFVTGITGTITPTAPLTYTLLVTNSGPSSATSVTVTDNLPAGLTFVSASGTGWTCSFSAPTVTCTRPTLSVGAAPAIQIVATAPVTPGLVLTNTATVNAATHPNTPVGSNSVVVKVQFRVFAPIVRRP